VGGVEAREPRGSTRERVWHGGARATRPMREPCRRASPVRRGGQAPVMELAEQRKVSGI
jgi:hypothetical protein